MTSHSTFDSTAGTTTTISIHVTYLADVILSICFLKLQQCASKWYLYIFKSPDKSFACTYPGCIYFYYSSCQTNVHFVSDIFIHARCHLVLIGLVPGGFGAAETNAEWHHTDSAAAQTELWNGSATLCNCSIKALWCAAIIWSHQKGSLRESRAADEGVLCPSVQTTAVHSVIMEIDCLYL